MQAGAEDSADLVADLRADQRSFYRARAAEYDQWWQRRGRYDHGPDDAADWDRQIQLVVQAVDRFGPVGDVRSWRAAPGGGASILFRRPQR